MMKKLLKIKKYYLLIKELIKIILPWAKSSKETYEKIKKEIKELNK